MSEFDYKPSDDPKTYTLFRYFQTGVPEVISTGNSREEVEAHMNDPETSSTTCTSAEGRKRTRERGPWFDGWELD